MNSEKNGDRPDDLCANSHPDDGVPPHVLAKRGRPSRSLKAGRHRLDQLCKQVQIALGESLVCDCSDPVVQDLQIESVTPVTGSTVLQVVLRSSVQDAAEIEYAYQQLTR